MGYAIIQEDVRLVDVSTKTIRKAEVIRVRDTVFLKYETPKYCSNPDFSVCRLYTTEKWAFPMCLSSWPWQRDFMDVLVKLKLMSKERRSELLDIDNQRQIERQREYDLEELKRIRKRYNADKQIDSLIKAIT